MSPLFCRMHGLKQSLLARMRSLTVVSTAHEVLQIKRCWQRFKRTAEKEATEPGEAQDMIESVWGTPEFKHYRRIDNRIWQQSDKYRAWKQAYDRKRYLARKEKCHV